MTVRMRPRWRTALALVALVATISVGTAVAREDQGPAGTVRIAYPEEPAAWHPASIETLGAIDLAALWGLPLYRIDGHGQLRAGLAVAARIDHGEDGGPWTVEVDLRSGTWSDGRPVVAGDVVATVEALRGTRYGPTLQPLAAAEVVDDDTVRLVFDRPYGRWPYLLAGGLSVLPAHVLSSGGIDAYADGVPVSGGPFRLESYERALQATFVAHGGSPLGEPHLERVEVYFTPSYETSLGLLQEHRVDVVIGHLALNPIDRARRVDRIRAAAPLGGTTAVVRWDGSAGGVEVRAAVRSVIDVTQLIEGLLGTAGGALTSVVPGHEGPWTPGGSGVGEVLDGRGFDLIVPDYQEVPAFTARVLQRDLRGAGAEPVLVRVSPDELVGPDARSADGTILLRRDLPRPSLQAWAANGASDDTLAALAAADAEASNLSEAVDSAAAALHGEALELPLYRVGVAHAWRTELDGLRPSAWPGLALWDAASWTWSGDPPPQRSTLEEPDASG